MTSFLIIIGKYLIGLLGIGLVVVIHEIGHLLAARACGIGVEVFSFGLGPKLCGVEYKGTDFRLSLLPFGGYCRLKGSDDLSQALIQNSKHFTHTEQGSLFSVHPAKRLLTYLAGPLLNLGFAILLYSLLASTPYKVLTTEPILATVNDYPTLFANADSPAYAQGLRTGDRVLSLNGRSISDWEMLESLLAEGTTAQRFAITRDGQGLEFLIRADLSSGKPRYGLSPAKKPVVGSVRPSTPEHNAGLKPGDTIAFANGEKITNDLDLLVALSEDTNLTDLTILSSGKEEHILFRPDLDEQGNGEWNFSIQTESRNVEVPPFSLKHGWDTSVKMARDTVTSLILLIQGKNTDVRQEFTGMARAALMIGDITTLGLESNMGSGLRALFYLLGVVSISLAIANLLPLPAFDGGQMLIACTEWVTGKRIRPRTYWILQLVGIFSVVCIFLFLGYVDMRHFLSIRR
ncbi:RIP metalloprotease RseP [Sphaerochaeta sp. PS]|uniref:RIP metalloprotease RseP n=1 Tax=Sphaerochaeta sp. PS TaxID=3076336 RepID=UPI0028A3CF67|nr:RIP metalloprotease RseP [Sphaerochaeta sp. PS]MDT4762873.1 RIP metalloprotease RseP [Sphaerochaeta sp. PS]